MANQRVKSGWPKRKRTKAEKVELLERAEEIYAKADEERTESEGKWIVDVMNFIHREEPRGRKKETWCDDWMHQIARARLRGRKPPSVEELAGLKPPVKRDFADIFEYLQAMDD